MNTAARRLARPPKKPKLPLGKQDWIKAATEILVSESINAVRVEVLAKTLKVSRPSFYWHFVDRQELLMEVLYAWRDHHLSFRAKLERMAASHKDMMKELLSLPFHGRTARREFLIESAIRAWARRDLTAAQVVAHEDRGRLTFYQQQFTRIGYSKSDAAVRAYALYSFQLSEAILWSQGTEKEKKERLDFFETLLTDSKKQNKKVSSRSG